MSNYENVKKSRTKRKEEIVYVMGERCQICGYDKCLSALELHHLIPTEKEFAFNRAENYSWEKLNPELQKCILVCANCHREIHQNLIEQKLFSSYISERAEEITKQVNKHLGQKEHYCKRCGCIVDRHSEYCVECSNFLRRKVERPTREELKELIRTKTFVSIGEMFNVSDNGVRKWCISYGLPTKKSEIKKYTDLEWSEI